VNCAPVELFKPVTAEELATIDALKRQHVKLPAGAEIIHAGEDSPELYTLLFRLGVPLQDLPTAEGRF